MRILVTDGMDKTAMAELKAQGHEVVEQFYESEELGKALRDFDVVVVRSKTKVRAPHIDEAKGGKLKLIIRGGVGVDNIDVKYAEANGITVKNTPKASSQSVAELAMGHMFSCARYLSIAGHTMREGKWEKKAYGKGIELQGKTLGIVGFGRIGQHLGVMAKAIGMTHFQTMVNVIMPQALRNIMPQIGNNYIINVKDTSVMFIIGFTEFFAQHRYIVGVNNMYFPSATVEMIGYLTLTLVASFVLRLIEKLMDGSDSYELAQGDQLVMAAGTYSHPDRGTPFDEVNREYTGEEKRNRIRIGLKNRNGSTRGGR